MKKLLACIACLIIAGEGLADTSLIKIDSSPHAKMQNVGLDEVTITGGFWRQRREVNRQSHGKPQGTIIGQYVDITAGDSTPVEVELIPYYAWNNREEPKMSVWLPLVR